MTPRDLAAALALTTVIADAAKSRKDELRDRLGDALDGLGVDAVRAELPDGTRISKSTLIAPTAKATVVDETAFVDWVYESRPGEVIQTVRDSYKRAVLERLVETETGDALDPETGELIPGIRFTTRGSYVSTRFEKEGRDAIVAAIRDGIITPAAVLSALSPTPALPEGQQHE